MEFTLKSGATLNITPSSFMDANGLKKAVLHATKGLDIDLVALKNGGLKNLELSSVADPIIDIFTSNQVEEAVFKCGIRAMYNGMKIDRGLFDDPNVGIQAREDFHEICYRIFEVNCFPLFKQTFSMWTGMMKANTKCPESKSTSNMNG